MAEPTSTTAGVVVAGAAGAGLAGFMAGVNGDAAVGALLGALVYVTTTHDLPIWKRLLFFLVSGVMGYQFSPAIVEAEFWGFRPFAYPGPAAFGAAVLVVTLALAAIRRRGVPSISDGGADG